MVISSIRLIRFLLYTLVLTVLTISSVLYINLYPYYSSSSYITRIHGNTNTKYPGSFLHLAHPNVSHEGYCNFNYGFPKELNYNNSDLRNGPEGDKESFYNVLYNVVEGKNIRDAPKVTYATHISADFTNYVAELARMWEGPISLAAFCPSRDALTTLKIIQQLCYCLPEMSKVAVHLVFQKDLPPFTSNLNLSKPTNCILADSRKMTTYRMYNTKVTYPVNVCRNVARVAATTEYILVSDVQLMPSEKLATKFLEMVRKFRLNTVEYPKTVFVLPLFEVDSYADIPRTKSDLLELLKNGKAVYFHRLICPHCQKFPGIEQWFNTNPGSNIKPLITVKRENMYHRWEPIYIGSNLEPFYNEALSWEGLQDKMLQMLEMCLIGYNFVILDGAFLVHWPGIKKKANKEEKWRKSFESENSRQYYKILFRLFTRYYLNPKCKAQ